MNILQTIENRMPTFSKGQRRIARYILDNPDKASTMTASRMGELAMVSESTVVRFASELDYAGYPAMQKALQELLRSSLTAAQRFHEADGRFREAGFTQKDLLETVIQSDRENLRQLSAHADRDLFDRAVERIISARHIYILGVRSSSFVAGYLHFYLHLLRDHVTLVQSSAAGEIFEQLFRVGPEDVLIAVSFPRYSQVTVKTVRFARDRGASIIAVTDNSLSPVFPFSETPLLAPCEMISFVDSMTAPLALVNALLVALGHRMGTDAVFSQLEDIWKEYGVFGKPEDEAEGMGKFEGGGSDAGHSLHTGD